MMVTKALEYWKNYQNWDDPPTEEQILQQFLYSAINDFVEANWDNLFRALVSEEDHGELDDLINDFVETYEKPQSEQPS